MKVSEAEEHIKTYRTELEEFCKSLSISLCLKERFALIPHLECETVTFIFDWKPEEHVLKDILELLAKVSGKLLKIDYIKRSTSISVTCSFPFSDVGFTVLRMIENIHLLMGQGLKKLTIGNLKLWSRQDVRRKELKEKDQGSLQYTDVISHIILEEAEYRLRDVINSQEMEAIELKQEILVAQVSEEESLSVQSDTESIKEVEEEPLYEELTVLSSQFNEIQKENKELSDNLSKMKVDYLRSLSSNTDSAASKVRRGMSLEIDDCKCCLEAMTRPDYQPLVDNKRIIEKLQERITLINMELITARKHNEKILEDIEDFEGDESEIDEIEHDSLSDEEDQICTFILYCNHPVTGELTSALFQVRKDELLPIVLDKAYKLMKSHLAPHIPIERCRLVKYNLFSEVMDQSFDLDVFQHQTIGQLMGMARYCGLFLETCKENESFKKYNDGGINLTISVVDLSTAEVGPAKPVRAEEGWTVGEFKQHIGELCNLKSWCMRLLVGAHLVQNLVHLEEDVKISSLKEVFVERDRQQLVPTFYVSSDPEDYQNKFKDSLMYFCLDFHLNSVLLNITIPPQSEGTRTTTDVIRGETMMKIISMNKENKEKERKIKVQVDGRITLAQLKEKLIALIGVPPTGFRVYRISDYKEYDMEKLDEKLMNMHSGTELIVRLVGGALPENKYRINLYLLQVNSAEFCKFMMESVVAVGTPVREFKRQIIEEAKVQGIDCVLELDKMRLREKKGASPDTVYLNHELIVYPSQEIYVEPLKGPEKKWQKKQRQVYVIRWRPSQCSVDPIEEIILDNDYHYSEELSELSGVPAEYISYAEGSMVFPVSISCLDIENKLKWDYSPRQMHLLYDGCVIYYKNNREKMKSLTVEERTEIQKAEEARLKRINEYLEALYRVRTVSC
ncbi:PREDICTED: ubiquitin carboxyl-terminal hydrolase 47-like [Amphimedon queenslandica]|uniref:Ubiquitin carboxyl-terminal hydrolase 47 C-terminal domain-containing protein n=1 Tax=Amphimedon queenslandica TaxID=400682 RepID=A0AAN0IY27_AMPQE|nr:PREDICTED: ubiquitin carboxyl-terminal hydrolase 47-like [Amphimedon queenslandica]|eukprot:XP_019849457.1 PREDICTED: ubiquitin carboxyl-terminal hydrolase 47-like [Amphimedon queenslandica]